MILLDIGAFRLGRPDLPAGTLRRWAASGWVTRHGYDARGRVLLDPDEVEKFAATLGRTGDP